MGHRGVEIDLETSMWGIEASREVWRCPRLNLLWLMTFFGAIQPLLLGQPLTQSLWHAIGGILAFAASAISWKYVKAANRAAVRAIVREAGN